MLLVFNTAACDVTIPSLTDDRVLTRYYNTLLLLVACFSNTFHLNKVNERVEVVNTYYTTSSYESFNNTPDQSNFNQHHPRHSRVSSSNTSFVTGTIHVPATLSVTTVVGDETFGSSYTANAAIRCRCRCVRGNNKPTVVGDRFAEIPKPNRIVVSKLNDVLAAEIEQR